MKINLDKKQRYLLACSFGPDSMALFGLLLKNDIDFTPVFVNYNLREESKDEQEGFINFCNEHNKRYYVKEIDKDSIKGNIEETCRKIRYSYFKEVGDLENIDTVLVAHHQDDLIETYLMQKNRKNLVKHYGIAETTELFGMKIIRPLLQYQKKDLIQYCQNNNIPFSIDSSNLTDQYLRNRIRHNIVDKLSDKERNELLNEISNKNAELKNIYQKLQSSDLTSIKFLNKLSDLEFCYAINLFLERNGITKNISKKWCLEIRKILESKKPNVSIQIHKDNLLVKSYDMISIVSHFNYEYSYEMSEPSCLDTPFFFADFSKQMNNRNLTHESFPIKIRNLRNEDLIPIKNYKVKGRRLMIDWKMPLSIRKIWPAIIDKNGDVIYVPRYQKDFVQEKSLNFYVKMPFSLNKKEKHI